MRKTILFGILVLLPAAIVSGASLLSCSKVECGTGTHEEGGKCVASLPNECGEGTVSQAGKCVKLDKPCGVNTTWNYDAGQCEGTGGGSGDGGTGLSRGARWSKFQMIKPASIATLANIQLPGYFADGTIVVILRSEPLAAGTSIWLHGGDGQKTSDDPLTYTFKEGFVPPAVLSTLSAPVAGSDGKQYTPFETQQSFDWTFKFLPGQPPLYMYKASLAGTIDPDGLPVSNEPGGPSGMQGTFKGCFTPTALEAGKFGAEDVYLEVLSQNLKQLIDSSGGTLDAECTPNGGVPNGYLLEAKWESTEPMDLTAATAQDDGGVSDAAASD